MHPFTRALGPAVLGLLSDYRDNPIATSDIVTHLLYFHEHACIQLIGDCPHAYRDRVRRQLINFLIAEPRARAVEIPINSTTYAVKAWQWKG